MKVPSGFTLVELMIAIVVLSVVLSLAVPSFRSMIQNNRATTIANDLVAALQTARSEALKLRANVTVCRRNVGGTACEDGMDWSVGWVVRSDAGDILRVWESVAGNAAVTGPAQGVTFRSIGMATAAGTFAVTLPTSSGNEQRCITLLASGGVNQTRTACQ